MSYMLGNKRLRLKPTTESRDVFTKGKNTMELGYKKNYFTEKFF